MSDERRIPEIKCSNCNKIMKVIEQIYGEHEVEILLKYNCACLKRKASAMLNRDGSINIVMYDEHGGVEGYKRLESYET